MTASADSEPRSSAVGLRAAHERFVTGQADASFLESARLRPVVAQSWRRCLAGGVNPEQAGAPPSSAADSVAAMRDAHPLATALPVIRQLLVDDASTSGVVVAVTAADGTLLWVEGDRSARRRAEAMNFVPGADWSERGAGTNAPGTALAVDGVVQIRGSEHFARVVQPWNCTAAPVHDRDGGALLGAIDVTGGRSVAFPQTIALLRATAVAVENHLALRRLASPTPESGARPRLTVLGSDRPRWVTTHQHGYLHITPLSGRHAELLVLLSRHPEGLTADHLAVLLDEKDIDVVTVRAEMSRLRRVIGQEFLASRPYRLLAPITIDADQVFAALDAGDVDAALKRYPGPLLPRSVSPGIARLRTQLAVTMRCAVLRTGNLTLLRRWLESPEGRDDRDGWQLLHDRSAVGSIFRTQAGGHLAGIDFALG